MNYTFLKYLQYFEGKTQDFLKERLNKNILVYSATLTAENKRKHLIGRHRSALTFPLFNSDTSCIFMTLFTRFMTNKRENISV